MASKHSFQAEVAQLLHLVTHSLYSNKEIFMRELISNASDACDKLRFEGLHHPELFEGQSQLEVKVSYDETARTITISDNGIGMTAAEAIEHLGTIAKSGTKDFVSRLEDSQKTSAKEQGSLIGQFGVGFYSAFIVADKVVVESRRGGESKDQAVRWTSSGAGDFETEVITKEGRGTDVTLHLRADEEGATQITDFLSTWKLRSIISKYAEHISLPILMRKEKWEEGQDNQPGKMVMLDEWEPVNKAGALWTRSKSDITQEQYDEFYKQISYDFAPPLAYSHNRVEGKTEYTQLLYIPSQAPHDLWNRDKKAGIKLYVKRVFIMDDAESLMPMYLRFVKGVIDSSDLPLNVSRELLQESRDTKAIREGNTRRVLSMLEEMAAGQKEGESREDFDARAAKFTKFYEAFGALLKEGIGEDPLNKEKLAKLLRFSSSTTDSVTVSFSDYKARMKEGQEAIYYITAETLAAAKNSPQLEMFRKKGIEVLLMTDRVDEWALGFLTEFDGVPLQSVTKGAFDLGKLQDEAEKKAAEAAAESAKPLVAKLKEALKDKAQDVRVTTRLVDSPACLVVSDHGMSTQLARLMKQAGQPVPETKPILEINLDHSLVKKLENSVNFNDLADILFDQALLAEGGLPDDPAAYVRRVNALLV